MGKRGRTREAAGKSSRRKTIMEGGNRRRAGRATRQNASKTKG
jgi:hypothetical protein